MRRFLQYTGRQGALTNAAEPEPTYVRVLVGSQPKAESPDPGSGVGSETGLESPPRLGATPPQHTLLRTSRLAV